MLYQEKINLINNSIRIGEKFYNRNNYNYKFNINKCDVYLKIPSNTRYNNTFIAIIILLEKSTSSKPIFLLDTNTLSGKNVIKIGLKLFLKKDVLLNYLKICLLHFVPKYYLNSVIFSVSHKTDILSLEFKKILSNTIFSFDNNIHSYYNYLNEFKFNYVLMFRFNYNNKFINRIIVSNIGVYNIEKVENSIELIETEVEKIISEEGDSSDIDIEIENININNIENDNINNYDYIENDNTNNDDYIDYDISDYIDEYDIQQDNSDSCDEDIINDDESVYVYLDNVDENGK